MVSGIDRLPQAVTGVENTDTFVFDAAQTGGAAGSIGAASYAAAAGDAVAFHAKSDLGGTADTLNISLMGVNLTGGAGAGGFSTSDAKSKAQDGGAAVNADDFIKINLFSTGDVGDENALQGGAAGATAPGGADSASLAGAALSVHNNATVTITGDRDLDMGSGVFVGGKAANTGAVIINAKEFTGKLTVTTGAGADEITGGKGDDTITGGKGADVLTGGAGKDAFKFAMGDSFTGDTLANATAIDKITDFAKGEDTLTLTGAAKVLATNATAVDVEAAIGSGDGTLTATVKDGVITLGGTRVAEVINTTHLKAIFDALDTSDNAANEVGVIVVDGNTYVVADLNASAQGATDVIQLQGVTNITAVTVAAGVVDFA